MDISEIRKILKNKADIKNKKSSPFLVAIVLFIFSEVVFFNLKLIWLIYFFVFLFVFLLTSFCFLIGEF